MKTIIPKLLIGIGLSACSHVNSNSEIENIEALSLITVLATPHLYNQKTIVVEGYIHDVGVGQLSGFYSFFPISDGIHGNGNPICEFDTELFISPDHLPRKLRGAVRQKVILSGNFDNTKLSHQAYFLHDFVGSFDNASLIQASDEQCEPHL